MIFSYNPKWQIHTFGDCPLMDNIQQNLDMTPSSRVQLYSERVRIWKSWGHPNAKYFYGWSHTDVARPQTVFTQRGLPPLDKCPLYD
jgi:hypothetical protein